MDALLATWLASMGVVLALGCGLWLLSIPLRNVSIVDIAWGPGFAVLCAAYGHWGGGGGARGALLMGLVATWALRLGLHLLVRNAGHGEDPRYAAMRSRTGPRFWWTSLFTVFILQGMLMGVVSLPLLAVRAAPPAHPGWLSWLGTCVFIVGLFFETVGDWQLTRFRSNPANRGVVMDRGLWRYTRHPNYFGDACAWWGIWIVALEAPGGWATVVGPLVMTVLLLKVSGVSLLERSLRESRPAYADYVARTNAFLPWRPRSTEPRSG